MNVGFINFDRDRSDKTGSARIRTTNLTRYADNMELFQTGKKYDVAVFQKFYWHDYAEIFPGIKILDICDPDWLSGSPNLEVVRFLEKMDGVVANTEATAAYIRKITNIPVVVIPDRHDMKEMKQKKTHKGEARSVVWFGYSQNAHVLKPYISKLVEKGLSLTLMSDKFVSVCGHTHSDFKPSEHYVKFPSNITEANEEMIRHDFALLPLSRRPQDQYKSNNKTTHAWALGLPVANWGDDIDRFMSEEERIKDQEEHYDMVHKEYHCKKSAEEYNDFVELLSEGKVSAKKSDK